jgi:hypothetical protein
VLWFSGGCAPEDVMEKRRLTVANISLGLGLGFATICESGWKQFVAILFILYIKYLVRPSVRP